MSVAINNLINFSRALPAPMDTLSSKKVKVSSKYGSGTEATLTATVIKAVHAVCDCMTGSAEGAVGVIDHRMVAEYKSSSGPDAYHLVVYDSASGNIVASGYDKNTEMIETYRLHQTANDGAAVLMAMFPALIADQEFEDNFVLYFDQRKAGYTDLTKAVEYPERKLKRSIPIEIAQECPITDVDTRHETYSALLSKLSLASDHRDNLLSRGLTDEVITRLEYRTTPVIGNTALAKQLLAEGKYLPGVPGFYHTSSGDWSFIREDRGILIPVRNPEGKIQGLQIRRDNVTKRKFRWVSSVGKTDGTRAEGWTHMAGSPQETILLTEGPMKADVIHFLTGQTVLAVPGVNSLTQLKPVLNYLREQGTRYIMTAFDMDYMTNPHVQNGYYELAKLLSEMGFQYGTYLWDPAYKGLDDYVWQCCYQQNNR